MPKAEIRPANLTMLCQIAHQFPPYVENFLERGRKLRRSFREESVTDILMSNLVAAGGAGIIVEFPNEPLTGADMEWNFANPDDGSFYRILVQAKRAYGEGKFWKRHSYKELCHQTGKPPALQAVTLCNTARITAATYPLFMFYHPQRTCSLARADGVRNITGASLADGYDIERLVLASKSRATRTSNKSLKHISPLLFPLTDLFCPPTILPMGPMAFAPRERPMQLFVGRVGRDMVVGRAIPPTPQEIRSRLVEASRSRAASDYQAAPSIPLIADSIPEDVMRIIEGRGQIGRQTEGLRHWRVTFVSQNPIDFEAELERFRSR